jgi:hypothetical protein
VGLITLQTWRGVPSHFNVNTAFDAFVNYTIDALISIVTLAILVMAVRSFGGLPGKRGALPRDMVIGVRAGMVLLLVSCLFGFWMLWYGTQRLAVGQSPELYGAAGVVKFVHGTPMHAIQILPLTSWLLLRRSVGKVWRVRAIGALAAGLVLLSIFAAVQTFAGRARLDVDAVSGVLLAVGLVLTLGPFGVLFWQPRATGVH